MMTHDADLNKTAALPEIIETLFESIHSAAQEGLPAHQVESSIWKSLLALGHAAFELFLSRQGTGDLGPEINLPNGQTARRLPQTHARKYRTLFGDFLIERTCYGSREGQEMTFVPLDNRLELPESNYSYLLQQWDQVLGCESAFARVASTIESILDLKQPVDSLERGNREMAHAVEPFRESRPLPELSKEGELFVLQDDGKGVVIRREQGDPEPVVHRKKGQKANKKRMAIVGTIYSVNRHPRTPEEMIRTLFRDPRDPEELILKRPSPVGKHLWARLSQAEDGSLAEPIDAVMGWQKAELDRRDPTGLKEVLCLMDGQEALWEGKERHFGTKVIEILDLMHVSPRLWQAAHLFHKEGSTQARLFVRERLLRVLKGQSKAVVKNLRRLGRIHQLKGQQKKRLKTICNYLLKNQNRMRYDEYLKKGYPIASGVIEGACRHYVKDRMERSGMRWTKAGAQAMLDVRSEYLNGDWQAFNQFRIQHETQQLYPLRHLVQATPWPMAA